MILGDKMREIREDNIKLKRKKASMCWDISPQKDGETTAFLHWKKQYCSECEYPLYTVKDKKEGEN